MILANHHLKSEKESKLRHEENFPLSGNILCNYLKECWKNGWLDEYSTNHFLIKAIENRLDSFIGEKQLALNNTNLYDIVNGDKIDYHSFSLNFCCNFSIKLQAVSRLFGEKQIKQFITDQLSAGKNHYNEDTFFQALSEISIIIFFSQYRWENVIYEPPVKKGENNKNPEASFEGNITCKTKNGKKQIVKATVNVEVKSPQFSHDVHCNKKTLIPAVLLSDNGRKQLEEWCIANDLEYLSPRVLKLKDYINSATDKFDYPDENEFNLLFINWSFRDFPTNGFLEAWSLMTNPYNGILINKKSGIEIGINPDAYDKITAIIVYTESIEGLMFNDFRYVWQRNGAGTRFRMYVLDDELRISEWNDESDILFMITHMNPSNPEYIPFLFSGSCLHSTFHLFNEAKKLINENIKLE